MLTNYIRAAMRQAHYEILSDDGTYEGKIPGFQEGLRQRGHTRGVSGGTGRGA
jgi:hypothetical protein